LGAYESTRFKGESGLPGLNISRNSDYRWKNVTNALATGLERVTERQAL